jgi:hypothetical protein
MNKINELLGVEVLDPGAATVLSGARRLHKLTMERTLYGFPVPLPATYRPLSELYTPPTQLTAPISLASRVVPAEYGDVHAEAKFGLGTLHKQDLFHLISEGKVASTHVAPELRAAEIQELAGPEWLVAVTTPTPGQVYSVAVRMDRPGKEHSSPRRPSVLLLELVPRLFGRLEQREGPLFNVRLTIIQPAHPLVPFIGRDESYTNKISALVDQEDGSGEAPGAEHAGD